MKSLQKVFNSKAAEFEIDKKIEYNITPPSKRLFNLPSQRVPSRLPTQRVQSRVPTQRVADGPATRTRAKLHQAEMTKEDVVTALNESGSSSEQMNAQTPIEWMHAVTNPDSGKLLNYWVLRRKDPDTKKI